MPIKTDREIDVGKYCVYVHIFPNGKKYVGITCRPVNVRWENGSGYLGQPYMARAINKYGWENILHIVLCENMEKKDAEKLEVDLIKLWSTNNQQHGYNIDNGGLTCGKHSIQTREKISRNRTGKCLGKNNCKYGANMKGENNPFFGKKHTEQSKEKMRSADKNVSGSNNPWSRRVICDDKTFGSVKECAEYHQIHRDVLNGYLSGLRKISQRFLKMDLRYESGR